MTQVAVWNADETFLHHVSLRHAVGMLHRKVAEVAQAVEGEMFGPYQKPLIVRLVRYVARTWEYAKTRATYSKAGVLARDKGRCAYCGRDGASTMDHVMPRSRGGETGWRNAVAACAACNHRKGNRTPDEAGMPLRWAPYVPTRAQLTQLDRDRAKADRHATVPVSVAGTRDGPMAPPASGAPASGAPAGGEHGSTRARRSTSTSGHAA